MSDDITPFTIESVIQRICELRGQRVMLDSDLAVLYGVETRYIPRAVKRNPGRFPPDFAFQLSDEEFDSLRSTFGISNKGRGGRRFAPYAFTEHGALMLSSVLNSTRADEISLLIIRAFVWMRQTVPAYQKIAEKLTELEQTVAGHDSAIREIIQALQHLMMPPDKDKRRIGF
ncbi:MAG: ORF6N domain-containing protein [Desulfovibrio sp.]|nr:ORF6N domain-containing protein [Desulfovibrio sp.]